MKRVAIVQRRLPKYRVPFFERLKEACAMHGVELRVAYGLPSRAEATRNDSGRLPWAHEVKNSVVRVFGKQLTWQHLPSQILDVDLIVLSQENQFLSNLPILATAGMKSRKVAFWGHGANFQSSAPNGLLENFKRLLITKVDWWFAYTSQSVQVVSRAGFPPSRITQVNNATDTEELVQSLRSLTDASRAALANRLGIDRQASVAVYCGSLYAEKRIEYLIEACDLIRRSIRNFHLIVIGDGPERGRLNDAARQRPWLHPMGYQSGQQKAELLGISQVMLNPGLAGLNIVDAFCAGLVFVTVKDPRHGPEIAYVEDMANGRIIHNHGPESYAEAIVDLFHNPELMNQLRRQSLLGADRYSLGAMVEGFSAGIVKCLEVQKE